MRLSLPNRPSASRARSTREALAAGADPAPLQDASGSTPHGQDLFFIFLAMQIVKTRLGIGFPLPLAGGAGVGVVPPGERAEMKAVAMGATTAKRVAIRHVDPHPARLRRVRPRIKSGAGSPRKEEGTRVIV